MLAPHRYECHLWSWNTSHQQCTLSIQLLLDGYRSYYIMQYRYHIISIFFNIGQIVAVGIHWPSWISEKRTTILCCNISGKKERVHSTEWERHPSWLWYDLGSLWFTYIIVALCSDSRSETIHNFIIYTSTYVPTWFSHVTSFHSCMPFEIAWR